MGILGFDRKAIMVIVALLSVWIFWGGTYLAIKFAVASIPPLFMAGVRFILAGAIMYGVARLRGDAAPEKGDWAGAGIVGLLLLLGGNGGVVLAAKMVPSGLTALLVATASLWIVVLNWLWLKSARPGVLTWGGVVLGLAGIGILTGSDYALLGASPVNPFWAGVLTAAAFSWALGSVCSRKVKLPSSAVLSTGMQMLAGGVAFIVVGVIAGETSQLSFEAITLKSFLSFLYLIVGGSLLGFSAYVWLLQNSSPVLASTYAYVNPLVAILLGAALDGEPVGVRTMISGVVILLSVVLITFQNAPSRAKKEEVVAESCVRPEFNEV